MDSDRRCLFQREPVDSGTDGWERDTLAPMLCRKLQAVFIAILKQLLFLMASASPYWTWRMNHIFYRQPVSVGNLCLSRPAAAKRPALAQKFRTRRPVDGSVYASPAKQCSIRRICNGITGNFRNIP